MLDIYTENKLLVKIYKTIKKEYIYAFLFSFIGGFIVHCYKFLNYLPNHDSLYNFYHTQNMISSGRWFLSVACGFSSYYDLPWVNGVLSLLFISLTTVIIVRIFEIENKITIFLISGLMVTYPSLTEILCFEFTADGYMFSMLLSALAVLVIVRGVRKGKIIVASAFSAVLICFTCGIYQAYVSFSIVLFICYFIWILLSDLYEKKLYYKYCLSFVSALVIGLIAYYVVWQVCMMLQGRVASNYQGIDSLGLLSFEGIIASIKTMGHNILKLFFEKNNQKQGISFYGFLNCLFIILSLIVFIISIIKSKAYKNKIKLSAVILSVILIPFAVFLWSFSSEKVTYCIRMMHSMVLVYVLALILCEKYVKNIISVIFLLLNVVLIFNMAVKANISYYYLNFEYENTYYEALEIKHVLSEAQREYGKNCNIAILGTRKNNDLFSNDDKASEDYIYTEMIEKSLLWDSTHVQRFLENVLYFDGEFVDEETIKQLDKNQKYRSIEPFFDSGKVEYVDDMIILKLG